MKPELMKELADGIIAAIKAHVDAKLLPAQEHIAGLTQRADRHYLEIEELQRRIEALEAKLVEPEKRAELRVLR